MNSKEIKLLGSFGFLKGEKGAEGTCEDCGKTCNNNRSWWRQWCYEFDAWEARCRKCALKYCEDMIQDEDNYY